MKPTNLEFGDMVTWEDGSQMDKMTYKGVITKIETKLTIVDEDGHEHCLHCGQDWGGTL